MRYNWKKLSFCVGLMLLLTAAVYLAGSYVQSSQSVVLENGCYQYRMGEKQQFPNGSKITYDEGSVVLENGSYRSDLSPAPVYYEGEDRLLTTRTMALVRPVTEQFNTRLDYFTEFFMQDGTVYLDQKKYGGSMGRSFLFDGKDTYIFLEPVTVTWYDKTQTLDAFSYAVVTYGQRLELYVRQSDTCYIESIGKAADVIAEADGYSINLGLDILTRYGKEELLFAEPEQLDKYKG